MKSNSKKTGLTLMWLAGLVIFLHAVIPHHHHYAAAGHCFANSDRGQVVAHVDHNCHAFNELISEDRTSPVTRSHKQIIHSYTFALANALMDEIKVEGAVLFLLSCVVPDNDLHLRDSHPVRGSPFV